MNEAVRIAMDAIAAERRRQIEAEGWTEEHDDAHANGELSDAADCYYRHAFGPTRADPVPPDWPWDASWWKPKSPWRDLCRAGALYLAEDERLTRLAQRQPPLRATFGYDGWSRRMAERCARIMAALPASERDGGER